jgi:hypothetical protein
LVAAARSMRKKTTHLEQTLLCWSNPRPRSSHSLSEGHSFFSPPISAMPPPSAPEVFQFLRAQRDSLAEKLEVRVRRERAREETSKKRGAAAVGAFLSPRGLPPRCPLPRPAQHARTSVVDRPCSLTACPGVLPRKSMPPRRPTRGILFH